MTDARVILWGTTIGAVSWLAERELAVFQYDPQFVASGIQLSPIMMPLRSFPYEFPDLPKNTFYGLPGLLADSLPDKFGNAVIDAWLAAQGRTSADFNPVERLCTTGKRGMGALEFEPALLRKFSHAREMDVAHLVRLSNVVLSQRAGLAGTLNGEADQEALEDILRVGTSAGGARAKAILAWNPDTHQFRSGQLPASHGFEYWILKFDGISNNRDKELADPQGFGKIEYAYYQMALAAGMIMTPCRLHHEGGRSHFMTKRFDRTDTGEKLHLLTFGAMVHADYNQAGLVSYEHALHTLKRLGLPQADVEQFVLRAMFNVVARNQDDHVKNISFLMGRSGTWSLSPAYDVTYAYDPFGTWTSQHQMSINGKRDHFAAEDLLSLAKLGGIKPKQAREMLALVLSSVKRWPEFAAQSGVPEERIRQIGAVHRLSLQN